MTKNEKDMVRVFGNPKQNIEEITSIPYIIKNGIADYFYNMTQSLWYWTMMKPSSLDITHMEKNLEWLLRLLMSGVFEHCKNPQHEITTTECRVVVLTNFINLWRGELKMGTSPVVDKWLHKYETLLMNQRKNNVERERTLV